MKMGWTIARLTMIAFRSFPGREDHRTEVGKPSPDRTGQLVWNRNHQLYRLNGLLEGQSTKVPTSPHRSKGIGPETSPFRI